MMALSVRRSTILCALAALMLVLPSSALAQQETTPPWRVTVDVERERVDIQVGDHTVNVMLALTSRQQQLGLGYRNSLGVDEGMLFPSEAPEPRTFWMKGMRMCLDIIWIEGGEITGAAENTCPDPEGTPDSERLRVSSPGPVSYVLETNAGWLEEHGYGVGTEVIIPEISQN